MLKHHRLDLEQVQRIIQSWLYVNKTRFSTLLTEAHARDNIYTVLTMLEAGVPCSILPDHRQIKKVNEFTNKNLFTISKKYLVHEAIKQNTLNIYFR